jgi:hypothetical protein
MVKRIVVVVVVATAVATVKNRTRISPDSE